MFIKSLYYQDIDSAWQLDYVTFRPLTLFLGLSGVGKSRILDSIMDLKRIIAGKTETMSGVEWKTEFENELGSYRWEGRFRSSGAPGAKSRNTAHISPAIYGPDGQNGFMPSLEYEALYFNDSEVFLRENGQCSLKGEKLPAVTPLRSLSEIFDSEPEIRAMRRSFANIFYMGLSSDMNLLVDNCVVSSFSHVDMADRFHDIITSDIPVITKLSYLFIRHNDIFSRIKSKFIDIFPYVEDMTFKFEMDNRFFMLYVKEKNTDWISQNNLSSGMYKTLMFIAQMHMLEGKCVVLVDEVENSLGLNCIDILNEELRSAESDDQFIVTSHHPFIINNIDMENWRIVSRKGGHVTVRTAKELAIGESSHENFFQLINSLEYSEGIE